MAKYLAIVNYVEPAARYDRGTGGTWRGRYGRK
jgi:hypothetical protein